MNINETSELAAGIIMPRLDIFRYFDDEKYRETVIQLCELGIGGFCIFNGNKDKTNELTKELQSFAKIPLIFSADFENGLTMRLNDGTSFPHSLAMGKSDNPDMIYTIAKAIAAEAKSIGVHWNLAPVCDINNNPHNPIINIRAFGENSTIVSNAAKWYINGTQSEYVAACAKHFPGHGDTHIDSHLEMPIINKDYSQLIENEFIPFRTAIESGVKSIMIGHLCLPLIDDFNVPATMSNKIVSDILRNSLGYDGIIISDAFEMKAIINRYEFPDYLIAAVNAGIDILLMPKDTLKTIEALANEIDKSLEFLEKIRTSNNRILRLKEWCGLINVSNDKSAAPDFSSNEKLALKSAIQSVSVEGDKSLLPIDESKQVAVFSYIDDDDLERPIIFLNYLSQAISNELDYGFIDDNVSEDEINSFIESLPNTDLFIFAYYIKAKAYKGTVEIADSVIDGMKKIAGKKPSIGIIFGNPYITNKIDTNLKILTYSDSIPSIAASVMFLSGRDAFAI